MDAHISVISDIKSLNLDIDITDWSLSNHTWVMNRSRDNPMHINADTFMDLNPDMIRKFQEEYDTFLSQFDGFIICHVPAFAQIYEKYHKPIIWINSCRFDVPYCFSTNFYMRDKLIGCLKRLNSSQLLYPVSNNKGDQLYTFKGTGINTIHIPSLCNYTNIQYKPSRSTFLLYSGSIAEHPLISTKKELGDRYTWDKLGEFKGIIHMPYEISTMSMFEHFTAGLPLFFPSMSFLKDNKDCLQTIRAYWKQLPNDVKDMENLDVWIELSDIYHVFKSPNTYYFDSIPHLFHLLSTFEYKHEGDFRMKYKETILDKWNKIILNIKTHRIRTQIPVHLCYNRLPLLANIVYDGDYSGSGVTEQHDRPMKTDIRNGDTIFVKIDYLDDFISNTNISSKITLVTGVGDLSPSHYATEKIISNNNIVKWVGCNIPVSHPKIKKVPIGVGEPDRINGNHRELLKLHNSRIPWNNKIKDICIPYHSDTHINRTLASTIPKLPFVDYMKELNNHKFVVCMRGNGIDTHRFCEALLMECVPIVLHSGLDDMYEQFPCVIVDTFDKIDVSAFIWNKEKYEYFLDIFWLRNSNILKTN